ncbi:MAG: carbohydrate porin [Ignavibacteriae bacterium]|nr:carbohydrate porin [Ignavibacteriota bacterium]
MQLMFRAAVLCLLCGMMRYAASGQVTSQASKAEAYSAENESWHCPSLFEFEETSIPTTKAIDLFLHYRGDQLSNVAGGVEQRGAYLHNVNLLLGIDANELIGWKGARFLVQVISNSGEGPNAFVGASQQVSNISAPKSTKLYQAWMQQDFIAGRLSFLAGLYDLNSEFYVTQTSSIFLNSSFHIGKELSQPATNGSGIFPNSAAALRVRFRPTSRWSFQSVVMDGVPGDGNDRSSPSLRLSAAEGAFVAGEVAYSWRGIGDEGIGKGKYTLGGWVHTNPIQLLSASSQREFERNYGAYFLAEQRVCSELADGKQGLSMFMRIGLANADVNQYDFNLSGGFVYTGLVRGRNEDRLGFAATHANNSSAYKSVARIAGKPYASSELVLELTYVAQLTSWLSIQPDLQHIIHPSTRPDLDAATVMGSRLRVGLD